MDYIWANIQNKEYHTICERK